jgi:uncharacterized damage-inducible protein DinB
MTASDLLRRLHEHRQWCNRNLLQAARPLSDGQLRQRFDIGQGSVWKSLTHLYGAEYAWLAAIEGNDSPLVPGDAPGLIPGNQEGADRLVSLAELESAWSELDERWNRRLRDLTDHDLDAIVYKVGFSSGKRQATRCRDVLLHVCTHAQYTTAQAVNMLKRLGASPLPEVMLISLARREPVTETA